MRLKGDDSAMLTAESLHVDRINLTTHNSHTRKKMNHPDTIYYKNFYERRAKPVEMKNNICTALLINFRHQFQGSGSPCLKKFAIATNIKQITILTEHDQVLDHKLLTVQDSQKLFVHQKSDFL